MDNDKFPTVTKELLTALDQRFPERSPSLTDNLDTIRFESGQRSVVRFLHSIFELQNKDVLSRRVTDNV